METKNIEWHKLRKPAVTICCASFHYGETTNGTYCYTCKHVHVGQNIRTATYTEMNYGSQIEYDKAYND